MASDRFGEAIRQSYYRTNQRMEPVIFQNMGQRWTWQVNGPRERVYFSDAVAPQRCSSKRASRFLATRGTILS